MGKGSSGSSKSTTTSTIDPTVKAAYTQLIGQAQNVAAKPYQQYTGSLVAGFTPDQLQAFQTINNSQGMSQPYYNAASDYAAQSANPISPGLPQYNDQTMQQYMSPYTQQVVDATQANINQSNAVQQQQLSSQAIQSGASPFGGDRAGVAQAELARNQNLASQQTIAGLYNTGFNNAQNEFNTQQQTQLSANQADRLMAANASSLYAGLGSQSMSDRLQGASAQLQSGALQQQLGQNQLDSNYGQFQQAQAYPFGSQGWLANIVEGLGNQGGSSSTNSTPAQPSALGQYAGLGLTGLSLLGSSGAFSGAGGSAGWLSSLFKKGGAVRGGLGQDRDPAGVPVDEWHWGTQGGNVIDADDWRVIPDEHMNMVPHLKYGGGLPHFAEGGGPGSGSHDSNHGDGDGGGSSGGSNSGGNGGTGPVGGGGPHSAGGAGGGVTGGGDHSHDSSNGDSPGSGSTAARGGLSSPEGGGGDVTGNGNPANSHDQSSFGGPPRPTDNSAYTSGYDPTSLTGLIGATFNNLFHPSLTQRAISLATMAAPQPIGAVASLAAAYGSAVAEKNSQVLAGVKSGAIPGTAGPDINGTPQAHVGGSTYGGTNSTRGDLGGGTADHSGGNGQLSTQQPSSSTTPVTAAPTVPGQLTTPIVPTGTPQPWTPSAPWQPHAGSLGGNSGLSFGQAPGYPIQIPHYDTAAQSPNVTPDIAAAYNASAPANGYLYAIPQGSFANGGPVHMAYGGDPSFDDFYGDQLDGHPIVDGSMITYPSDGTTLDTGLIPPPPAAQGPVVTPDTSAGVSGAGSGGSNFMTSPWGALLQVGLHTLASGSPFAGQAIGQGAAEGLGAWQQSRDMASQTDYRQQQIASAKQAMQEKQQYLTGLQKLRAIQTGVDLDSVGSSASAPNQVFGGLAPQSGSGGLSLSPAATMPTSGGLAPQSEIQVSPASSRDASQSSGSAAPVGIDKTGNPVPVTPIQTPSGGVAPMIDLKKMMSAYNVMAYTPGMEGAASSMLEQINKNIPEGSYLGVDGKIYRRSGANEADAEKHFANQGMVQDQSGGWYVPADVVRAEAGEKGAIAGTEANARNASDLRYKPAIEGGVRNAQNASDLNYKPAIEGAIAQAQVAPHVAEDRLKTHVLSSGQALTADGKVLASVPMQTDAVDLDGSITGQKGATYKTFVNVPVNSGGSTTTAANAPSVPATTAPTGVTPTGMGPLQKGSLEAHAADLEKQRSQIASDADDAKQANFTLQQMQNEMSGWNQGKLANMKGEGKAYLQTVANTLGIKTPDLDDSIGNYQAFQKNAMRLTTQATRAVSSRAAVQEMQMIAKTQPTAETSKQGLGQITNQLGAVNDFSLAKQQAAKAWSDSHNGTLDGFDDDWNANVTPAPFLFNRMSSNEFQATVANMQKTPEGRKTLSQIRSEIHWASKNNLLGAQ